jgi:hypothetical protein
MDRFLLANVPRIVELQKTNVETIQANFDEAIERTQLTSRDSYDHITVLSMYWESDDTGSAEDSNLFIETLSQLENVQTHQQILSGKVAAFATTAKIYNIIPTSESRRLFILHYAGHTIAGSTTDTLMATPRIDQELGAGPQLDITYIKNGLKEMAGNEEGLDVLLVLDSCHAAISGRGKSTRAAKVELMVATAPGGVSNSREDGQTFTQHWCSAFSKLLKVGAPFTCEDLHGDINSDAQLEQFPATYILREGWDVPITFRVHPGQTEPLPAAVTSRTVITALHIEENPDSAALKHLIDYLNEAPVPITILAVLLTSSTLLLLQIPLFLQELLLIPQVTLVLK